MSKTAGIASVALLLVTSFAMPLQAQMTAGPNRPPTVPEGYVVTPSGYLHPSCIYTLSKGALILAEGAAIKRADGSIENVAPCSYPRYTPRGELVSETAPPAVPLSSTSYFPVFAQTSIESAYAELYADWNVPQAPTTHGTQLVFFWPGLESYCSAPCTPAIVLQPVLGWNDYYSNGWGISSVECCINGNQFQSSPVGVAPGDIIEGKVQANCPAGTLTCASWNITTLDVDEAASTTLSNASGDGLTYTYADGAVLEEYYVSECSEYPPSTSLEFYNIQLYDYNFDLISSPVWGTDIDTGLTPQCNFGAQPSSTQITLDYGATLPQTSAPSVSNIQVTTNGGGPSGTNYVYTMTLSDSANGATIYYSISACGEPRVLGSTSPGQFVYKCTGHTGQANLYIYALTAGHNPSSVTQASF